MNGSVWIDAVRAVAMVVALPAVVQVLGHGVAAAATIPASSVLDVAVTAAPESVVTDNGSDAGGLPRQASPSSARAAGSLAARG
jgi:hypothetical protein